MFELLQRFALYAAILVLAACSAVTVTTNFDPSTAFDKYRTYALTEFKEGLTLSPSSEKAFRVALRNNLAARGLQEATDNVDLYVLRYVSTKEKTVVYQSYDFGYDYGYGFGRYGAWAGVPRNYTDVSQYTEGTLIIDFVDAKKRKLVFRGIGKGSLGGPQTNTQRISEAVQKIILEFPKSNSR